MMYPKTIIGLSDVVYNAIHVDVSWWLNNTIKQAVESAVSPIDFIVNSFPYEGLLTSKVKPRISAEEVYKAAASLRNAITPFEGVFLSMREALVLERQAAFEAAEKANNARAARIAAGHESHLMRVDNPLEDDFLFPEEEEELKKKKRWKRNAKRDHRHHRKVEYLDFDLDLDLSELDLSDIDFEE